jgi:hypothetical protein
MIRSKKNNFISISKKKFGKNNAAVLLIFVIMFSLLGVIGIIIDWESGLSGLALVTVLYLVHNFVKFNYFLYFIGLSFVAIYLLSEWLDIEFLQIVLSSIFLTFLFFIKSCYKDYIALDSFEIFYLDSKELRCLSTENDADYKGYALHPRSYLKKYATEKISAISFKRKDITIAIDDLLILPRALTGIDLEQIYDFVKINYPDLLKRDEFIQQNLSKENQYYIHKIYIFSPILVLALVIYFFGNNGKDHILTLCCLILMVILPVVISKSLGRV